MESIVSRSLILDRAQRAVESGQPLHHFQAWPVASAAGQLFQRYVVAMQENDAAVQRVQEAAHG